MFNPTRLLRFSAFSLLLLISALLFSTPWRTHGQGAVNPVAVVSAASFAAPLAPNSIAAAFGQQLATRLAVATTLPLPTTLAGTTVRVNGEAAPLFFVSSGQINFLIPPGTPAGTASVSIVSSEGASSGTVQIAAVAPALFTANANGQGPLAAQLLRVRADGQQIYEPLAQFNGQQFVTRPIEFGPADEQLFLVLYLTGVRQAAAGNVRVSIGGVEYAPQFVGAVAGLAGLDQINVPLPRNFGGRGRITLLVKAAGATASNAGEFELGSAAAVASGAPLEISAPAQTVLAGEVLEVSGSGFAANPLENNVQVISADGVTTQADVLAVTGESLRIRIPFGAGTGALKVTRGADEANAQLRVKTSLSGFVEDVRTQSDGSAKRTPVPNVTIRVQGSSGELTMRSDAEGSFVLPEPPVNEALIVTVDGATASPCYIREEFKLPVRAARDNQFLSAIALKRKIGANLIIGGGSDPCSGAAALTADEQQQASSVTLTLPDNAVVRFPNGATSGVLNVTAFDRGRTPALLPVGHFSSTIAQIAPFRATITPGAKLTFANDDRLPANAQVRLFKFDQTPNSATLGQFIDVGAATVSADGQRIETAANAITETSYYFVSIPRPTAAINGRVLESDGRPVPRALVQARGQATFTDGFGGFVLRDVPVLQVSGDRLRVEVSYQRPDGRVARKDSSEVIIIAGALATVTPEIVLDPVTMNFPPVILAPTSLTLQAGETREFDVAVTDPNSAQTPHLFFGGGAVLFTALSEQGAGVFRLRLSPGANAAGNYSLSLLATDAAGATATRNLAVTVNAGGALPIAHAQAVVTPEDRARAITLTGLDPTARPLTFTVVTRPARGSLSGVAPNLVYTPAPNFNGVDSFSFRVSNGSVESQLATVFIAITPVNDAPVLSLPPAQVVNAGEALSLIVTATDVDGEQNLRFTATGLPPGATLTEVGGRSRQLSWTPGFLAAGRYVVNFRVEDGGAPPLSSSGSLVITVGARWSKTSGPEGGRVIDLVVVDKQIYARLVSTRSLRGTGVYASNDEGRSWTRLELPEGEPSQLFQVGSRVFLTLTAFDASGVGRSTTYLLDRGGQSLLSTSGVPSFEVYAASGNRVYIGYRLSALGVTAYTLSSDGRTWMRNVSGLTGRAVTSLTVKDTKVFAGVYGVGIFVSSNGGQTWTEVVSNLPDRNVTALAVNGAQLLAGTACLSNAGTTCAPQGSVFISNDDGVNWTRSSLNGINIFEIVVGNGQLIATATTASFSPFLLYFSSDNGQTWTRRVAPDTIESLALGGAQLFIGGNNQGVFVTGNSGQTFARRSSGMTGAHVVSFLTRGTKLFAGTVGDGVYVSPDGGQSWNKLNAEFGSFSVYALAAKGSRILAGTTGGLYVSADEGQTWTRRLARSVYSLAVSGNRVLAGTNGEGAYTSDDDGQNWQFRGPINEWFWSLLVVGQQIFAGTNDGEVYLSTNNGDAWTRTRGSLPTGDVNQIISLVTQGNRVYASVLSRTPTVNGVYFTTDGGATWTRTTSFATRFVERLLVSGSALFACTYGEGVFVTYDGGQRWERLTSLPYAVTPGLGLFGEDLLAGTDGDGVYRLTNNTQSWQEINFNLGNKFVNALALSENRLFAGTLGSGVFRSLDQGQNWAAASTGLPANANVQSLVTNGATLWAATFGDGVYASDNQGANWRAVNTGLGNRFVNKLFVFGAALYAGTEGGVFRSMDGGANWTALNAGLTALRVTALGAAGGVLYAGTEGGVFRLDGANWTAVNRGLTALAVQALAAQGATLYAGTSEGGVFILRDGGQNWAAVNNQLPANLSVFAFAVSGRKVYAGSVYGVFVTENDGQTWRQINAGLLNVFVTGLAVSGEHLFASTASGGVFVSRIP